MMNRYYTPNILIGNILNVNYEIKYLNLKKGYFLINWFRSLNHLSMRQDQFYGFETG